MPEATGPQNQKQSFPLENVFFVATHENKN
jgi:hypothetical protein